MENLPHQAPMTWHDIDAKSCQIAGNTALVQNVAEVFSRYPGLNIKFINRLEFFDHTAAKPDAFGFTTFNDTTIIFNMDRERSKSAVNQALQSKVLGHPLDYDERTGIINSVMNVRLDEGHAVQFGIPVEDPAQKPLSYHYPLTERQSDNMVLGMNDILTRQEVLAVFSQLPREDIRADLNFSLAEMHAFVRNHEYMHARANQVWFFDEDFKNPNVETEAERVVPSHKLLKLKLSQAQDADDPYWKYLNEQIADTAAVLHHMYNGGSPDLIENVADARACSFANGNAPIYYSTTVLDKILENEEIVRQRLSELEPEQIDELSAYLVGAYSWDRDEFYGHAAAAQYVLAEKMKVLNKSEDDIDLEEDQAYLRADEFYEKYSPDFKEQRALMAKEPERVKALLERSTQGAVNLTLRGQRLNQADHLAEVQAVVKYNQELNPEFNTPQGGVHLLGIRARGGNRGFRCDRNFDAPVQNTLERRYHALHVQQQAQNPLTQEPQMAAEKQEQAF